MLDQAESLRRLVSRDIGSSNNINKKTKIITVASGKGGVGKSNFVVNTALFLSKQGKKVLIFDADVGMGNDDVLMGIYPRYNVMDLIKGRVDIEDVIVDGPEGVNLLPGGSGLVNIEDLKEYERTQFLEKLETLGEYDYIFIDTGAGINRSVLAFITASEELIVVTTPEPTSLTDAYSLLKAVNHFKIKTNINVVVNRVLNGEEGNNTYLKFKRAINKFLTLDISYLGCIYDDRKLTMAVREQKPVILAYSNSDAAKSIASIGIKLIGTQNTGQNFGARGLFKRLFNIFS